MSFADRLRFAIGVGCCGGVATAAVVLSDSFAIHVLGITFGVVAANALGFFQAKYP